MIEIKRKELRFFSVVIAMALILGMIPAAQVRAAEVKNYYVDPVKGNDSRNGTVSRPLKTVGKALEKAKDFFAENEGAEVTINLKDGEYRISDTLEIDEKLMNNGKLTLQAQEGETPVISGGQSIDGWSLYDAEKNIYAASLSGANPRQLTDIYRIRFRLMFPGESIRVIGVRTQSRSPGVMLGILNLFTRKNGRIIAAKSTPLFQARRARLSIWQTILICCAV